MYFAHIFTIYDHFITMILTYPADFFKYFCDFLTLRKHGNIIFCKRFCKSESNNISNSCRCDGNYGGQATFSAP